MSLSGERGTLSVTRLCNKAGPSLNRNRITDGVCSALERMKLHRDNQNLMEQIDVAEVLLRDLEDLVNTEYYLALERFEDDPNQNLLAQLNKLPEAGQDAYWTNGHLELAFDPGVLPWRE
jgi:hypothetical protein